MKKGSIKKNGFRQVIAHNLFLFKLCFKAAPACMILLFAEHIRNEIVVFMEYTFGLNYVLECAEYGTFMRFCMLQFPFVLTLPSLCHTLC